MKNNSEKKKIRPVAFDGESFGNIYALFGNSETAPLINRKGIRLRQFLEYWRKLDAKLSRQYPNENVIYVGFVIHYDITKLFEFESVEMRDDIFSDDPEPVWISETENIFYIRGKMFCYEVNGKRFTWYDVKSFFNGGFEAILKDYLGKSDSEISWGKKERDKFTFEDMPQVVGYNAAENRLLVEIMYKLIGQLEKADCLPNSFHGASAIAQKKLNDWKIKNEISHTDFFHTPPKFFRAVHSAYFGGRIELLRLGSFGKCFAYDINSAYPAAMCHLPDLRNGEVRPVVGYEPDSEFGLYYVEWDFSKCDQRTAGFLPFRYRSGCITYPATGRGWYYQNEVKALLRFRPENAEISIKKGYVFDCPKAKIGDFVSDMYARRLEYKKAKDDTEYALKIGLNSIYGKFAQSVGKRPFFCPIWAGMITSYTRAKLIELAAKNWDAVIGFATDSVFFSEPVDISTDKNLGGWGLEIYSGCVFVMSGVYFFDKKLRTRGYAIQKTADGSNIDRKDLIKQLNENGKYEIFMNQFITHKISRNFRHVYGDKYGTFERIKKELNPYTVTPGTKREYELDQIKDWGKDNCGSFILPCSSSEPSFPYKTALLDMTEGEAAKFMEYGEAEIYMENGRHVEQFID